MKNKPKIYERNPDTSVIRWRYLGEHIDVYEWPHYGNILTKEDKMYKENSLNDCQKDKNFVLSENTETEKQIRIKIWN